MIDTPTRHIVKIYVELARANKEEKVEFVWSWKEELDRPLQKEICRFAMGLCPSAKVTSLSWGFIIEFK